MWSLSTQKIKNLPGGGGDGGGVVVRGQGTGIWVHITFPSAIHVLRTREVCIKLFNCYSLTDTSCIHKQVVMARKWNMTLSSSCNTRMRERERGREREEGVS